MNSKFFLIASVCIVLSSVLAWKLPTRTPVGSDLKSYVNIFNKVATSAACFSFLFHQPAFADLTPAPWDSNIKYEVVKASSSDVAPVPGDLVIMRFKGVYKDVAFDDTFSTEEPYFYRCGVGLVVKGLDDSVVHMHIGDRLKLRFGGDYAFPNGKPSSPGKPRIPPKADVDYEVELLDVPGKGQEYILDE